MKGDHQVILALVMFFIGIGFNNFVISENLSSFKDFIPALATLISAFFGARYAFKLKTDEDERKENEANLQSANLISFNLILMLNRLVNYRKQFIEPFRDHEMIFIAIPPSQEFNEDIHIDLNSLSFLINNDNDGADLVVRISIEIEKHRGILGAISQRSRYHLEQIQPALEEAGITEDKVYNLEMVRSALGDRKYIALKRFTDDIIENLDESIVSLNETSSNLKDKLNQLYPNKNIVHGYFN